MFSPMGPKRCPCCGGIAEMHYTFIRSYYYIKCCTCGLRTKPYREMYMAEYAWDRRVREKEGENH